MESEPATFRTKKIFSCVNAHLLARACVSVAASSVSNVYIYPDGPEHA